MMKRILVLTFVVLLSAAQNVSLAQEHAQPSPLPAALKSKATVQQTIARIEKVVPRLLDDGIVPGLAIALVQNGKLVWHRGFGVKNAQSKEPVADNTLFEAASLSKPVFAYGVLKLVDAGKMNLDTPLSKYLPGNYDVGDDARLHQITARHVLSHTPGFPNWRRTGQPLTIHFTPGERFSYSGEGFVYLAKVVEKISGLPFNDFMQKTVFDPLGMTSSSYIWQERLQAQAGVRHNSVGSPAGQNKNTEPNAAASLQTTAQDFGRFIAAILNGTGLKPATRRLMLTPQIKISQSGTNNIQRAPEMLSPTLSWGLGWGLQTTRDGLAFWHWGDNGNTKAYTVTYDKERLGLVIFTNSANGLSIIPEIVDEALGGEQTALAWLNYESYKSPAKALLRTILARGVAEALSVYRQRRAANPQAAFSESQINRLGYDLIGASRVKDAIEVFKLNVEDFPQSSNVYDSLGEAYLLDGNKELAIKNYQRSVELDPNNTNGIETLKKLREK